MTFTSSKLLGLTNLTVLLLVAAAFAGCHGLDETDPEPDHSESRSITEVEVFNRDTGEELLDFHDDHWDGPGLPDIAVGEGLELSFMFEDQDGQPFPLGTDEGYEVRARVADDAATGIISIEDHVDHIDIEGLEAGTTSIAFELWHDDQVEWTSPATDITVVEGEEESE